VPLPAHGIQRSAALSMSEMSEAVPKHHPTEQLTSLPTSPGKSVGCDRPGAHIIDLAQEATPAEETINADEPVSINQKSEHELLHELSAAAIESSGADLGEPSCYLPVFGFKEPEMEAAYHAFHSPTVLTGHQIFASVHALFLLIRGSNLLSGNNYLEPSALTVVSLCIMGIVAVSSASCCVHFSGRVMKLHQSFAQMTNAIGLLALMGWLATFVDILFCQTGWDEDKNTLFHCAYFIGMIFTSGATFVLVMLRMSFRVCSAASLMLGVVPIISGWATGTDIASFVAFPLLQVPACLPPQCACLHSVRASTACLPACLHRRVPACMPPGWF